MRSNAYAGVTAVTTRPTFAISLICTDLGCQSPELWHICAFCIPGKKPTGTAPSTSWLIDCQHSKCTTCGLMGREFSLIGCIAAPKKNDQRMCEATSLEVDSNPADLEQLRSRTSQARVSPPCSSGNRFPGNVSFGPLAPVNVCGSISSGRGRLWVFIGGISVR